MMKEENKKETVIQVLDSYYHLLNSNARYVLLRGSTRCFVPGTECRLHDGSLKNIEDIINGDKLINEDNSISTVTDTHSGYSDLYKITQNKGVDYIVTPDHQLCVRRTRKTKKKINYKNYYSDDYDRDLIYNFSAEEFSKFSNTKQKTYSGFKNNFMELPKLKNKIDAYYLGLWLGDGTSRQPYAITTVDKEIEDYLFDLSIDLGLKFEKNGITIKLRHKETNHQSKLSKSFYDERLYNNKHIPKNYIYTCYEDRLKLIAGLVDSDGYDTKRNTLQVTQKRKNIIEELEEILIISGFHTRGIKYKLAKMKREDGSVYECDTYYIEFNHPDFKDLNKYIKIPRKRINKSLKNERYMFNTKIKSDYYDYGKYYGFTLDNNPNFRLKDGTIVHNSGKTVSIIQYLLTMMMNNENIQIVIGVETLQQAKKSVLLDLEEWIERFNLTSHFKINKSDYTYEYDNGSKILVVSADKPSKWFGLKADIFWFNEATHIDYNVFEQAQMRLPDRSDFRNKIILDFNPTNPFSWVRELENSDTPGGVECYVSTYKDNPFLGDEQVRTIESWKETNYNKWLVYGEGEYGEVEGAIYTNWGTVDAFPRDVPFWVGLDFGFTNDPTAIIKVAKQGGELYVEEICYERGLTNQDIATMLKDLKLDREDIIADSAEPKSIQELQRERINVTPAKKGPDSVKNGIDILQRYKINVIKTSKNITDEIINYSWKKDKSKGEFINKPAEGWDHGLDALRYVALLKLNIKPVGSGIVFRSVGRR